MFTDEFDKLFDVDDYTLDTYVEVIYITGSSKEIEHIEFEIFAFYDSSKKEIRNYFENNDYSKEMNYAFCELDYVKEE